MDSVAVIADVHGNHPALAAVLEDIHRCGASRIYCLGDLVGYYCMINETIALLREWEVVCILGNHDYALAFGRGEIGRSRTATSVLKRQLEYITPEGLSFLESLPRSVAFRAEGRSYFGVHGGLDDALDEYIREISPAYLEAHGFDADVLLSGQTHVPMHVVLGEKAYANPGSVGQPRDGDPRASYMLIEGERIVFRRVPYDVERIIGEMRRMGFPEALSASLRAPG
jgi:putative phosphoesterase